MATQTFSFTGSQQTWAVPTGVTSVTIECWGAAGGSGYQPSGVPTGGLGGYAKGTVTVTPGETIYIYVGGQGQSTWQNQGFTPAGGYNGGGRGSIYVGQSNSNRGGGGGASDARRGGATLGNRIIVAGGGGGGGVNNGGGGGGGASGTGNPISDTYGYPGTQSGGGGLPSAFDTNNSNATAGSLGQGGDAPDNHAGGGGGGYYGGGPGSSGTGGGYGGGGGSGYVSGTNTAMSNGVQTGNGQVVVTWNNPPGAPTVTYPNGGEKLNRTHTITWTPATDTETAQGSLQYHIQISTTNGSSWTDIVALTAAGATTYNYDFSVHPGSPECLIRVRAYDGAAYGSYDQSNTVFAINHQTNQMVI